MRRGTCKLLISTVLAILAITVPASLVLSQGRADGTQAGPDAQRILATPKPKAPKPPKPPKVKQQSVSAPAAAAAPRPAVAAAPPAPPRPVARAASSSQPRADKTALLIGVNKAPGTPTLEGSITDANNMRDLLVRQGFKRQNIVKLTDAQASRGAVLAALDSLAARTSGKGMAVFMLASHTSPTGPSFVTGDGGRISASELASRLGRVPGKLWTTLATCYGAGYSKAGIVGKNRIAVFSSPSDKYSYQLGSAGSWTVLYMIRKGMLEGQAKTDTIEGAYHWAKAAIEKENPDRKPIMSDGISGDVRP